jgi:hypothetical protein
MVTPCVLRFDDMEIAIQKAFVPDEFIYLFQESDRRTQVSVGADGDEELDDRYFALRHIVLH